MKNKSLLSIFIVVFLDLLGFGIVIPILPYYATTYQASGLTLGVLMMCYSGMQFLFSPVWGRLSDRYGRRPIILLCIVGMGFSMLLLGWAPNLFWLFVARIFAGFFGANISAASAYIADVTTPEERTKGMGLLGAAFGLGFLFGPALGGLVSKWGYGTVGYVACGLSLINFIFAFLYLHDAPLSEEDRAKRRHHLSFQAVRSVFSDKQTIIPITLFFLVTLSMAQIETVFGLYLLNKFGLDAFHAGGILALSALVMILVQGGGIGKLSRKFGENRLIVVGSFLMFAGIAGVGFGNTIVLFIMFMLLHTLGYALTNPSLSSLTSKNTPEHLQGLSLGVYHAAGSLGRIVGPLIAGVTFDMLGLSMPFAVAAGVLLAALSLALSSLKF